MSAAVGSNDACGEKTPQAADEIERLRADRDVEKRLRKDSDDLATELRLALEAVIANPLDTGSARAVLSRIHGANVLVGCTVQAELERLRAALAASCDEHRSQVYDATTGGGCVLLHDAVTAERERFAKLCDQTAASCWAAWDKHADPTDLGRALAAEWLAAEICKWHNVEVTCPPGAGHRSNDEHR